MRAHLAQDFAIAALAAPQYGIVSHAQLSDAGIGRSAIVRRVAAGRLHGVHRGVYAVGHTALAPEARGLAAVLACGEGALLSHHSAAALWGIHAQDPALPHVCIPTRNGRCRPAIVVHRSDIDEADRGDHSGIPVTTPERTLSDVARGATEEALTRWVREAEFRDLLDEDRMREILDRRPVTDARARLRRRHADAVEDGGPDAAPVLTSPPAASCSSPATPSCASPGRT